MMWSGILHGVGLRSRKRKKKEPIGMQKSGVVGHYFLISPDTTAMMYFFFIILYII